MATRKIRNNTPNDIYLVDFGNQLVKADGDTGGDDVLTLIDKEVVIKRSAQLFTLVGDSDMVVLDINDADIVDVVDGWNWLTVEVPATVEVSNSEIVSVRPKDKKRIYIFTPNWCDKTTWYQYSVKVTDKNIGTGDGSKTNFIVDDVYNVIEIGRGKVTDDHNLIAPDSGDYRVVVKTGTPSAGYTTLTEREEFESSGGDYTIDYVGGTDGATVEFAVAPALNDDVLITYYYVDHNASLHSCFEFGPPVGKQWVINHIEAQFTSDVDINDSIIYQPWIDHPQAGKIPVPGENPVIYHNVYNYDDYVIGALPSIPAWGGSGPRSRSLSTYIVQWDYASSVVLDGDQKVYMRIWTKHNRAFGGTRATVTIYAVEEDILA